MRRPSFITLMGIPGMTPENAQLIRAIMVTPGRDSQGRSRMERIDAILRTHGVEYIPQGKNQKSPAIYYCNAGDTYTTTILQVRGNFVVGCWGDYVERGNYE